LIAWQGTAVADITNDGHLDMLITVTGGPNGNLTHALVWNPTDNTWKQFNTLGSDSWQDVFGDLPQAYPNYNGVTWIFGDCSTFSFVELVISGKLIRCL